MSFDMSIGTETPTQMQAGGNLFYDFLNSIGLIDNEKDNNVSKSTDIEEVALEKASLGLFDHIEKLIEIIPSIKFTKKNKDGRTVLHYVCMKASSLGDKFINEVINRSKVNVQDNNGNTALILAAKSGNNEVCDMLVKAGAKTDIKNNEGESVGVTDTPNSDNVDNVDNVENNENKLDDKDEKPDVGLIASMFNLKKQENTMTDDIPENINTDKSEGGAYDTDKMINDIMNKYNIKDNMTDNMMDDILGDYFTAQAGGNMGSMGDNYFDELLKTEQFTGMESAQPLQFQMGGYDDSMTEDMIDNIIGQYISDDDNDYQYGGYGNYDDEYSDENLFKGGAINELQRMMVNQANEIHKKVVKDIKDMMEVDDDVAKNYKAVLWKQVKEDKEFKDKTNLDQSIELANRVNKKVLKKIDPKEGAKIREENRKKSEERRQMQQVNKKDKNTKDKKKTKAKKPAVKSDLSATSDNMVEMPSDISLGTSDI